jgi:hypothetical protein
LASSHPLTGMDCRRERDFLWFMCEQAPFMPVRDMSGLVRSLRREKSRRPLAPVNPGLPASGPGHYSREPLSQLEPPIVKNASGAHRTFRVSRASTKSVYRCAMNLTIAERDYYDLVQRTFRTWATKAHPVRELVLRRTSPPGKAKDGAA